MYVKWRRGTPKGFGDDEQEVWVASLRASVRVDGKVKTRHIASLGSIGEREIHEWHPANRFWEKVDRRLRRLESRLPLTREQRAAFAQKIAEVVPRPPEHDRDYWAATVRKWEARGEGEL